MSNVIKETWLHLLVFASVAGGGLNAQENQLFTLIPDTATPLLNAQQEALIDLLENDSSTVDFKFVRVSDPLNYLSGAKLT